MLSLTFRRVLIANRGEIACRIIRGCRSLGLETVAIYSDADREAMHVLQADQAVCVGPPPAGESYLSIPAVIAAAKSSGADALHPGYGFLSENPELADACEAAGLVFIGPPASAMRALALKDAAKSVAWDAGVPVLTGSEVGTTPEAEAGLGAVAERVGFPVLLKAVAGGGGKGMRRVDSTAALAAAVKTARREALATFGDDRLLMEKFIPQARHVEVQILADNHGHVVHLFERDCSLQRRRQKVLEEAPAPQLDPGLRWAMGGAAVRLAQAVGYRGVGTVEFILDPEAQGPDRFWFMEMNTRLQVEHPVTEMVTGQDLVALQLRVASGEPLPFDQSGIPIAGHAIEVRLCAEDPARNDLPSPGRLTRFDMPGGARVETGYRQGDEVTPWYDNLLAKIIVQGADRPAAISALEAALGATRIEGVATNLAFLRAILAHAPFRAGEVRTTYIDEHRAALLATAPAAA